MLQWHTFCAHRLWECCCGVQSVHVGFRNVAVAYILCTSTLEMYILGTQMLERWLRLAFGAHRLSKCCCGLHYAIVQTFKLSNFEGLYFYHRQAAVPRAPVSFFPATAVRQNGRSAERPQGRTDARPLSICPYSRLYVQKSTKKVQI